MAADYTPDEWEAIHATARKRVAAGTPAWLAGYSTTAAPATPRVCRCSRGCCTRCSVIVAREGAAHSLPADWLTLRRDVLRRDHWRCRRCRASGAVAVLTVHHVNPRDSGGSNDMRNLVALCVACHDWAEVQTAERGLSWAELTTRPVEVRE